MEENLALSAAQIQYLKIGPKVGTLQSTTRQLQESLNRYYFLEIGSTWKGLILQTI